MHVDAIIPQKSCHSRCVCAHVCVCVRKTHKNSSCSDYVCLQNQPTSPRSTPNSSPHSRSGLSPTFAAAAQPNQRSSGAVIPSLGSSPGVGVGAASASTPGTPLESSLTGVGGDVRQAFQGPSLSAAHTRSLRNDLLVAADSVTSAMSSLVKELNSGRSTPTYIAALMYDPFSKVEPQNMMHKR